MKLDDVAVADVTDELIRSLSQTLCMPHILPFPLVGSLTDNNVSFPLCLENTGMQLSPSTLSDPTSRLSSRHCRKQLVPFPVYRKQGSSLQPLYNLEQTPSPPYPEVAVEKPQTRLGKAASRLEDSRETPRRRRGEVPKPNCRELGAAGTSGGKRRAKSLVNRSSRAVLELLVAKIFVEGPDAVGARAGDH